ncbi:MAG: hypothetical protein R3B84_20430 [Zavarzinella sp.]
MNWTKGLFRIWIIASVGIVLSVAGFSYPEVKKEFETWNLLKLMQANDILMVPVHCAEARGRKEQDYFQAACPIRTDQNKALLV